MSTNTAMLLALQACPGLDHEVTVYDRLGDLPIFSPDLEQFDLPQSVRDFVSRIAEADGVIFASPEYVHSIPGGLKNGIDWLVSREEIIQKPIALMHASHRGDDMLDQLRLVLGTVSARFRKDVFVRFPLMKLSPDEIEQVLKRPDCQARMADFLNRFADVCATV